MNLTTLCGFLFKFAFSFLKIYLAYSHFCNFSLIFDQRKGFYHVLIWL